MGLSRLPLAVLGVGSNPTLIIFYYLPYVGNALRLAATEGHRHYFCAFIQHIVLGVVVTRNCTVGRGNTNVSDLTGNVWMAVLSTAP